MEYTEENVGEMPDYTNASDLSMMAEAINMLTGENRSFYVARLIMLDLMRFSYQDPATAAMVELARERGVLMMALAALFSKHPELVESLIEQSIEHMLNGKDETDPKSAGGWNDNELQQAYATLFVCREGLSIPFQAGRLQNAWRGNES